MIYWRTDIADVIIQTFFPYILTLYYIKQIDSKLPCFCSVIDHRGGQNVEWTKKWHTRHSRVCHWCSYHILTSSVIYYWTDTWQLGIYLLDIHMNIVRTESMSVCRFGSNPNATPLLFLLDEIVCVVLNSRPLPFWWPGGQSLWSGNVNTSYSIQCKIDSVPINYS